MKNNPEGIGGPTFSARIIAWQQASGRRDLPWQNTRDPYRIWLSEVMLQQTQVNTVIPYYLRFLERFPTLPDLAAAPSEAVAELWAGLGYYSRARNLHRCAQTLLQAHDGIFPARAERLRALPGIGRSTAAAIAAFAWGERSAILDGNVKRVLCRHFGIAGFPGEAAVERELWRLAESLLPESGIEAYTQGLMDLGATLCTRSRPRCVACPLSEGCVACREGRQSSLPTARPRPPLPEKTADYLIVSDGLAVLLERRPPTGLWSGLLTPPEGDARRLPTLGIQDAECTTLPERRHGFTHFRLLIRPVLCRIRRRPLAAEAAGRCWLPFKQAETAALPAPFRRLLKELAGSE